MEIPTRFAASLFAWIAVLCALTQASPNKLRHAEHDLLHEVNPRLPCPPLGCNNHAWRLSDVTKHSVITAPTSDVITAAAAAATGSGAVRGRATGKKRVKKERSVKGVRKEKGRQGVKKGRRGNGEMMWGMHWLQRLARTEARLMQRAFRRSLRRHARRIHKRQRQRGNFRKGLHTFVG